MSKILKSWIFVGKLDWIFGIECVENPIFLDFWSWIRLDVQSSIQSKIQKKIDFLILTRAALKRKSTQKGNKELKPDNWVSNCKSLVQKKGKVIIITS
jgi:hypothetical protein